MAKSSLWLYDVETRFDTCYRQRKCGVLEIKCVVTTDKSIWPQDIINNHYFTIVSHLFCIEISVHKSTRYGDLIVARI